MNESAKCLYCQQPFDRLGSGRRDKFCGMACYWAWRRQCGKPYPNQKLSPEQRRELVRLYTTPQPDGTWMGGKTLAAFFQITMPAVYNILRKEGVPPRDAKEAHARGKRCKPIKNLPHGEPHLCKCGCGQPTAWNQRENQWRPYVLGHYRPVRPYHDRAWLYDAYVTQNRTIMEIALAMNVNLSSIAAAARKLGIPLRDKSTAHMGRCKGPDNGSWRGGTTPERQRLYKQGHWRAFCQGIYARDDFRCQRCGRPKSRRKGLHAHHVKPWASNPALRFDRENVLTLCDDCHTWVHSSANTSSEFLS